MLQLCETPNATCTTGDGLATPSHDRPGRDWLSDGCECGAIRLKVAEARLGDGACQPHHSPDAERKLPNTHISASILSLKLLSTARTRSLARHRNLRNTDVRVQAILSSLWAAISSSKHRWPSLRLLVKTGAILKKSGHSHTDPLKGSQRSLFKL